VCLLARGARGEAYNLCSGAAVSVEELFAEAAPGVGLLPAEGTSSAPVVLGDASRARALGWTPAHARAETLRDLRAALARRVRDRHG
jgi:nucleoside-diphosphate-sugar epimerase